MEIKINVFPFLSGEAFNDAVKKNIHVMADALLKRMVDADAKIQNDKAGILMLKNKTDAILDRMIEADAKIQDHKAEILILEEKIKAMQQEYDNGMLKKFELNSELDANIADFKAAQEILRQLYPSILPESWK